jgi:hypothetical protein
MERSYLYHPVKATVEEQTEETTIRPEVSAATTLRVGCALSSEMFVAPLKGAIDEARNEPGEQAWKA